MSYQSHADVGGQEGHGRVMSEQDEPFDAAWEPQAMALMLATASTGSWNVDMARSVLETLSDYRELSYYQKWMKGLEKLAIDRGLLTAEEILAGRMLVPPTPVSSMLRASDVFAVVAAGASTLRDVSVPARFAVGEAVYTKAVPAGHHTRLPRYAEGKLGRIEHVHGAHVFPDTNSQGLGEQPQWLYTVSFSGRELWGEGHAQDLRVSIDAWESYLEGVEGDR